jgi:hypothetical protein
MWMRQFSEMIEVKKPEMAKIYLEQKSMQKPFVRCRKSKVGYQAV